MKVLIANRGEIARRIERTCVRLGHEVVGVQVTGDAGNERALLHGDTVAAPSYLDGTAIIEAGRAAGVTAVHPGFGFLAENAEFAQQVIDAGLTWIGPSPAVIAQMGSKIHAREIAEEAGVPLIPGYAESQDDAALEAAAARIGFPVLVKASAGGGGKGIRIARSADDFGPALNEARTEAERSFGDGSVIVERYVERPRHIEVQVIGDAHGNVYHLGTRECSVQRRYQKLFEEAPAPNLPEATRNGIHNAAVALARAVDYTSAGTVEFIVDDDTGDFFFLEMNTRLQVEHPVTEEITGVDLIELMLSVAAGDALPDLSAIEFAGHALEARITAEDAGAGFVPAVGRVLALDVPAGVRWESALEVGVEVTPAYDAMIAKLVVRGADRAAALESLRRALDELVLAGVVTTTGFHRWLVDQPPIIDGRVTTRFLDESDVPVAPEPPVEVAGQIAEFLSRPADPSVWHQVGDFSLTPHVGARYVGLRDANGVLHEAKVTDSVPGTESVTLADGWVVLNEAGHTHWFEVVDRTELWGARAGSRDASGDALTAPFPAAVAEVHVAGGERVDGGQVLVVIEAMKMLHSLTADGTATVDEVLVAVGDQVAGGQPLVTFALTEEQDPQ